jgi:hypothetical protein
MQDEITMSGKLKVLWKDGHIEILGNITNKSHVMYEEIEGRIINSGIVSYHSLQNLSSFRLLSNNVNIKDTET